MDNKNSAIKETGPYAMGMLSYNMEYIIVAQLTFALTTSMGMNGAVVGLIFLVSRLFDGFTDIIAGYVIDKCNPKMGKARIYDFIHVPLWIALILVFSVPDIGGTGKVVWVFVFYNLLQSVFATFMNVAEPLRLQRSVKESDHIKATALAAIGTLIITFICQITMPLLIAKYGSADHGWTIITLIYAVPFSLFGLARLALLPEKEEYIGRKSSTAKTQKVTLKDMVKCLLNNKYVFIFGGVMICWAMFNTLQGGSQNYYYQYVYGDIRGASVVNLLLLVNIIFLVFIPKFVSKFGKIPTLRASLFIVFLGCIMRLFVPNSLLMLTIANTLAVGGIQTLGAMKPMLNIDCIMYGRWKNGEGIEATYSTMNSLTDKLGLGLGSVILGMVIGLGGFDQNAATQSASAIFSINLLYSILPAILMLIAIVLLSFFDLDKKLPQIKKELLEERGLEDTEK